MFIASRRRDAKLLSGLAGAAALAAGSQAYAQGTAVPIAIPADIPTPPVGSDSATINWNADGLGANDFAFQFRNPGSTQVHWQSNMNPVNGAVTGTSVVGFLGPFINYATNVPAGQNATPTTAPGTGSFRTATQVALGSVYGPGLGLNYGGFGNGGSAQGPGHATPGGFPPGAQGYAVFRIGQGATARVGWLQLRTGTQFGIDFIAAGLGEPGGNIVVGAFVPEPTSLGALAIGAVVALARPRRKA
jgi:hypothetical protein